MFSFTDFVCTEYHKHDHDFKEESFQSEEEIKLRHLESDISQLRSQRTSLKKQFAMASKLGEKVDCRKLKMLDNKICYRMKRRRILRSRIYENCKEPFSRCARLEVMIGSPTLSEE